MRPDPPLLVAFCGPNGAGKSTLQARTLGHLPLPFVNADLIAAREFGNAAADHAYDAASLAEAERTRLFEDRVSFSFETVLSDPVGGKVAFLRTARDAGYQVVVHFVGLDSSDRSRARVFQRVTEGGHDVPDDKLEVRYPRVLANLARLLDIPDDLVIYDNSSSEDPYRPLARLQRGHLLELAATLPDWIHFLDLPARSQSNTRILP